MKSAAKLQKNIDIFGIFKNYLYFCAQNYLFFVEYGCTNQTNYQKA